MASAPIPYVKAAILRGSIFGFGTGESDVDRLVSGVDTQFFVHHAEPLEALGRIREHRLA